MVRTLLQRSSAARLGVLGALCGGLMTAQAGEFDVCNEALQKGWRQGEGDRIFYPLDFRFSPLPAKLFGEFDQLSRSLRARGTELIIVLMPTPAHINAQAVKKLPEDTWDGAQSDAIYSAIRDRLSKGSTVVDLAKIARASKEPFFYKRDFHWTVEGARLSAQAVAKIIKASPAYKDIPRADMVADISPAKPYETSSYNASMLELCKTTMTHELAPRVVAHRKTPPAAVAIIEETPPPSVAVVGSSFMDPLRGFSPYLSEAIQAETLTFYMNGGQALGALLSYLRSDEFQKSPPRFLVWDVTIIGLGSPVGWPKGSTFFQEPLIYRQIQPSIQGECSSAKAVLSGRVVLSGAGTSVLLENLEQKPLVSRAHYLELKMDKTTQDTFQIETELMDGTIDTYAFVAHNRVTPNGRFFLSLPQDSDAVVKKISVITPEGASGGLTARLCPLGGQP